MYEVRRWGAWHRFITLSLLAHAFVSLMRAQEAWKSEAQMSAGPLAGGQKGAMSRTCCR
ncbi:MAG: hypothetical protein JO250_21025 [Armatimonadetes bacterium]|nr:hypothetical protein [Armatimonadota bacterium]